MNSLLGKLYLNRQLLIFAGSSITMHFCRLIAELVTMSVVGPLVFGYWKLLQLLFTYSPLAQLGITNGANRNIPYFSGRKDDFELSRTLATTLTAALWNTLVAGLLAWAVGIWSLQRVDLVAESWFPLVLGVSVAGWTLFGLLTSILRSLQKFYTFSLAQGIVSVVMLSGLPLIYRLGMVGLLMVTALAAFTGVIVAVVSLRKHLALSWHFDVATELITLGLPILTVGLIYSFLTTLDRIIIATLAGPSAVGTYSLAIMTFGALSLLPLTISRFFYPSISLSLGKVGSPQEAMLIAKKQIRLAIGAIVCVAIIVAVAMPLLVPRFLPDYTAGIGPAFALMPGLFGLAAVGGYANWLNAMKFQGVYLRTQVLAVVLSGILSISFYLLGLGLVGIALGTSAAFIIYAVLLRRATSRILGEQASKVVTSIS